MRYPRQIGSVIPSSRFLERRVVTLAETRAARVVVELGSGTGGTTRAILASMSPGAKLLSVDINPKFCGLVERIRDPRLHVHCGSAGDLRDILQRFGLPAPDVVISGIPFSTMTRAMGSSIIQTVAAVLAPGGRFVAYQVSGRVAELSRPVMGQARVEVEVLNIPPMRLYRWDKPAARHAASAQRASAAAD